ncbi:5-methyltetrahydropteroyltriglutamate--homocysteine methyltransferase [Rhizobiales bacterium GAS191]|jgi:5-methyltetrahydropteroyltriglutamate--homocysteine methyltransferase|nr:5-methyltetrahydropteroyltriglutamate--homocysteine methyltransferase [Rhizobiales bacterium GAS113]SED92445.1 5-methyltetrahydropteroyltriglutamate--homocysteine methyltransferase [Rhizobiales bacterium GAS191]SEE54784.1 5-methyltetrahydropteroyltriglutamate--homocysteine methyltransferase [Rhizobiales bacterium GAS188]
MADSRAEERLTSLLPTTVVGSYPQPDWLVDREKLKSRLVPRLGAPEIWRVPAPYLEEAKDDATLLAIRDMEVAGIDIVTDGEIRRESYSNRFALALEGVDGDNPAEVTGRTGAKTFVPRVVGAIRRRQAVELRDAEFLKSNTDRVTKITLPGPFTMSQQAANEYYADEEEMAMAYAAAVNAEARDLKAVGIDVIQLDEPWLQARPEAAARYGVKAINRALEGIPQQTIVHMCFGYAHIVQNKPSGYSFLPQLADCIADAISIEAAQPKLDLGVLRDLAGKTILLGVIDLGSAEVESAEEVASRIRRGLEVLAPEHLVPAPDCGMKYLTRELAFGKLKALVEGAARVRHELAG